MKCEWVACQLEHRSRAEMRRHLTDKHYGKLPPLSVKWTSEIEPMRAEKRVEELDLP